MLSAVSCRSRSGETTGMGGTAVRIRHEAPVPASHAPARIAPSDCSRPSVATRTLDGSDMLANGAVDVSRLAGQRRGSPGSALPCGSHRRSRAL